MFFWYIAACLSLVTLGCWIALDLIDMRAARRNDQQVAWWKTKGIRSNVAMLVMTIVYLLFGMGSGIFEIFGTTIYMYMAIICCIALTFMLVPSLFVLYVRLKSSRKQLNVPHVEGSREDRKKDERAE